MKILYLHHGTILGGAPISLMYLVREIERQSDLELEIASHAPAMRDFFALNLESTVKEWANPITFLGKYLIGYIPLDSKRRVRLFLQSLVRFPPSVWRQYRALRRAKPDLVHLNSAVMFSSALAAWLAGIPIVWHVREPVQGEQWKQRLSGLLIRSLAKRVITISEVEASRLSQEKEHKKINIVNNPLDFDKLRPGLYDANVERKKLGVDPSCKLVVSLGGATPRKGALEQIQAMQHTDDSTRLLVAGPPLQPESQDEYHQKLYQALSKLPSKKVQFTGIIDDVTPLLAACDLLLFTGMTPHFPRPVFEAWMMRKPVIVFDMEGVSNQVTHGVDGIIVKELTGQALGEAIAALLQDSEAVEAFGQAGRQKAEDLCNPVVGAQKVLAIYQQIAG